MGRSEREADFQAAIITLARLTGWLVYHTHDSRRSAPGWPDLALVRGPRVIFAELKTTRGGLRGEVGGRQRDRAGMHVVVILTAR